MDLKDKLNRKKQAAYGNKLDVNNPNSRYIYSSTKLYKKKKRKPFIILAICIASFLVTLIGFIYLPQFFILDNKPNSFIGIQDDSTTDVRAHHIDNCGNLDFDNDGLTNSYELSIKSDVFRVDSDKDGIPDGIDSNPTKTDKRIVENLRLEGVTVGSSYEVNGVIMWADDEESLMRGGAILLPNGHYRITNFKGWVAFPDCKYAYMYKDGMHTELQHREKENAWRIDEDCEIVITNEKPEQIHRVSFFNNISYWDDGGFSSFISSVLPTKGFVSSQKIWLEDTFVKTDKSVYATDISYNPKLDIDRFTHNNISLNDLTSVYNMINKGKSVFVSLINDKAGETILVVIGYTKDGHLILSSLDDSDSSVLYIYPCSAKSIDENNHISLFTWYEFYGCGYNSHNGDTISYFVSTDDSGTNYLSELITESTTSTASITIPTETGPTIPTMPQNGTMDIDGDTFYYINGVIVTDSFLKKEDGKYKACSSSDSGAFYVNSDGIKLTGKITVDGNIYYYNDGFYRDCFVICGDSYSIGSQYTSNTVYVNSSGQQVYGWFDAGNGYIYASQSGYIAHNCFVTNSNGQYRYVGEDGTVVTNKLITVDGIEIIIDESGNIVNENYAINIINSYLVY